MSIAALLFADGRLPVGGHAHSAGLEPAVAAGLTADRVPEYLLARLATVGRVEAAATVLSHRRARSVGAEGGRPRPDSLQTGDSLQTIQAELLARTASLPVRRASGRLGRGLVRLIDHFWHSEAAAAELLSLGSEPPRAIALGVACSLSSMDEREAARVCLYDDAETVASAALKLLPVDPLDPVGWMLDITPTIEQIVQDAVAVENAAALPANTAPQVEQWALAHDQSPRRVFSA